MLKKTFSNLVAVAAVVVGISAFAVPASATLMTTTLDFSFGTGAADGSSLDVIISDEGLAADQVSITFDATNLTDGARVDQVYLNFSYSTLLESNFGTWTGDSPDDISVCSTAPTCTTSSTFQADGDGIYDIVFSFNTANKPGSDNFSEGETTMSVITFGGITIEDFIGISEKGGDNGPFCMAAHIISNSNTDPALDGESDWLAASTCTLDGPGGPDPTLPVPEPSTLTLFGFGLAGLGVLSRRRRKKAAVN